MKLFKILKLRLWLLLTTFVYKKKLWWIFKTWTVFWERVEEETVERITVPEWHGSWNWHFLFPFWHGTPCRGHLLDTLSNFPWFRRKSEARSLIACQVERKNREESTALEPPNQTWEMNTVSDYCCESFVF